MIDTHAHLYAKEFHEDITQVISNAKKAGVSKILLPNIDLESLGAMDRLIASDSTLFKKMYGLHPCSVDENYIDVLDKLEQSLDKDDFIAIGEIGIDLYWDKTFKEEQKKAFLSQCSWAKQTNRPIVIHSRESTDLIIDLLKKNYDGLLTGVFHCFTGTAEQAHTIIDMGYYLGIGGVVTFKNTTLRKELESVPLERLVLETDSPYLSPVPYRGKRNESAYVYEVAKTLADVYNLSMDEVIRVTTSNAIKLFNL
jgi:TatD DNase family protein